MTKNLSIILFSWRDYYNPKKGGAEVLDYEILKKLASKGYSITWLSPLYKNSNIEAKQQEFIDGINYIRMGNSFSVHKLAIDYFLKNQENYDLVLDEYHGYPFFTNFYINKPKATIIHEVAGDIWFKMVKFPFSLIGFIFEKVLFKLLKSHNFITVSESTKSEILKQGISSNYISIIPEGSNVKPIENLEYVKHDNQICFVGRICQMKGVTDLITALNSVKMEIPDIQLYLVGKVDPKYQSKLDELVNVFKLEKNIIITGFVSEEEKIKIMQESIFLVSCSVKEGWGLVVTESNVLGTPAITYNVAGYRDAVKNNITGFLTKTNTPMAMAKLIIDKIKDKENYKITQKNAYDFSKTLTWDNAANEFEIIIQNLANNYKKKNNNYTFRKFFIKSLFSIFALIGHFL